MEKGNCIKNTKSYFETKNISRFEFFQKLVYKNLPVLKNRKKNISYRYGVILIKY